MNPTATLSSSASRPNGAPMSNGASARPIDPGILLLIEEIRRGQDALRIDLTSAQKDMTRAIRSLTQEVVELRKQAPGRLSLYALSGVVALAMVALLGILATRGVDPLAVAHAAAEVAPVAP